MSSTNEYILYSERVAKVRSHLSLSQGEISAQVGISLRAYQNYERGEREVPVALVKALYNKFRVDPIWLLTGFGAMILNENERMYLDQPLLSRVVEAVSKLENELGKALSIDHKSRLIGLLYQKSILLNEVTGEAISDDKVRSILKLVA